MCCLSVTLERPRWSRNGLSSSATIGRITIGIQMLRRPQKWLLGKESRLLELPKQPSATRSLSATSHFESASAFLSPIYAHIESSPIAILTIGCARGRIRKRWLTKSLDELTEMTLRRMVEVWVFQPIKIGCGRCHKKITRENWHVSGQFVERVLVNSRARHVI